MDKIQCDAATWGNRRCSRSAAYVDEVTGRHYCKQHAGHPATPLRKHVRAPRPGLKPIDRCAESSSR